MLKQYTGGRVEILMDTGGMKSYLAAGLVCFWLGAAVPGAWLPRQPNVFEAGQLVGCGLLLVAAYVALVRPRVAARLALAGVAGVASFMVRTAVVMQRERPWTFVPIGLALAMCVFAGVMAVRALRGPERPAKTVVWGLGQAWPLLLVVAAAWFSWPWRGRRDPVRYLVPASYVGWVVIDFDIAGAPPLPVRAGAVECAIPVSGRLRTSSLPEFGVALDDWESVDAAGQRTPVAGPDAIGGRVRRWSAGVSEVPGKPEIHTEQFFVGTEAEFAELGEKTYPENQ